MYRFERKITVKNVADMSAAMQFANDVTDYLNKRYDLTSWRRGEPTSG